MRRCTQLCRVYFIYVHIMKLFSMLHSVGIIVYLFMQFLSILMSLKKMGRKTSGQR